MVRKYQRTLGVRKYKDYKEQVVEEALGKVTEDNFSIRKASVQYGIPFGTLYNRYKGLHIRSVGRPTLFTPQEELQLVKSAATCGDWGYPLSKEDMQFLAKNYLDKQGKIIPYLTENKPGIDWVDGLLIRNKSDICKRVAANIKRARATVGEGHAIKRILISGFAATGVFPYDPLQRVLSKIPGYVQENEGDIGNTLIDFLKEQRFGGGPSTPTRQKKKMVKVVPGKSVTHVTADSEMFEEGTMQNETEDEAIHDEDDEQGREQFNEEEKENENCNTKSTENLESTELKIGSFVLVKMRTVNTNVDKYFVGKITEIILGDDIFNVSFLRFKKGKKNNFFVFPDILDESFVQRSEIIGSREPSEHHREQYVFKASESFVEV
ncbi:unnamed protein product [Ceutorhynchus assimilis]|uniref:HTH psq-type domain-containing protein n=1 Tax=Ceutorhynchus assimilis TaxID=467358 RepID=A0A9N9QJI3_9CUCU|nr:unnamed protein product [Ceutorhynchus assimilis]